MTGRIKVVIVAGIPLIREGLRGVLADEPDFDTSTIMTDMGTTHIDSILAADPDVVLLDVQILERDGWELIGDLRKAAPRLVTLIISDAPTDRRVGLALELGAHGYLLRDSSAQEMAFAIRAANKGTFVLHPSAVESLIDSRHSINLDMVDAADSIETQTRNRSLIEPLSQRELDVLRLMTRGLSNKRIASELFITEHTVKFHIRSILGKLGATNRTEAVTLSLQRGLVTL